MDRKIQEEDFFFGMSPEFKNQYRRTINKALKGDKEALKEQHRLIDMLTRRINAHLGDGMEKPKDIKKGTIF